MSSSPEPSDLPSWVAGEAATFANRVVNAVNGQLQERDAANQRLTDALERAQTDLDESRTQLIAEREGAETIRAELAAAHQRAEATRVALQAERQRAAAAEDELRSEQERGEATRAELAAAHESLAAVRAELAAAQQRADGIRAELTAEQEPTEAMRAALKAEQERTAAVRAELKAERERAETSRAEVARMTAEFESTLEELRHEQATVVGEQAAAYSSLPLDALLTMFNSLKRSSTLSEVLMNLVEGIAREFSRVALFDVRGNHLEGSHQVGFDFESGIPKVVIPLSVDSLLSRAVNSGRMETFFTAVHSDAGGSVPFGGTPACAMAIPIVVQGATIAVIYADDSDKPEFATAAPQMRAKFAELLQQHALLVLLKVEVDQKKVTELREFASLLVDEIEYAHVADANAGMSALERQQGLKVSLERSRRIFAERTAREAPVAAALLDDHLKTVIESRGETVFGRDLASLLGSPAGTARASVLTMRR